MSNLSRVLNRKKSNGKKSTFLERMATRKVEKKVEDCMLLGDLFVSADEGAIVDINKNYNINNCRVSINTELARACLDFNGLDSNINIKDRDKITLGIEDFTLDWWEYPKELPVPNRKFIKKDQYVMYKNSLDRKQPFKIKNENSTKIIYLSSDGDVYDIASAKYMGGVEKDTWAHWALVRCNNNFYTFKNGKIKNIWASDKVINPSDEFFTIGSGPKGDYFYGYMNNIRFTKEQALWTEEFNIKEELFY